MDAALEAHLHAPAGSWLDVRHEDLLEDPRGQVGRILDFLGLDWTPRFESGFARHHIAPSRGRAWRHDLSHEQIRQLERTIAAPLLRYGYELTTPQPAGPQPAASHTRGTPTAAPSTGDTSTPAARGNHA
jgi:hypothetical protein